MHDISSGYVSQSACSFQDTKMYIHINGKIIAARSLFSILSSLNIASFRPPVHSSSFETCKRMPLCLQEGAEMRSQYGYELSFFLCLFSRPFYRFNIVM